MKAVLIIILACLQIFSATAQESSKLKIVSSASMISDIAFQIAGNLVDHGLIVPIGGDPHLHEPTPRDAQLVASADQIFINGLTFEGWILELIHNSGTKASIDTITSGIEAISSSVYKDSFDPHAWMDVRNGIIYANNIKDALIKLDPDNTEAYIKNHADYIEKLTALDKYIEDRIQEIPETKRVLITSHDAFAYYGKRYGLELEAIIGISTEAEAQTSDIIRITDKIKSSQVPAIFIESTINPKLMEQIAKDNNVSIGGKLYADSIGEKNSAAPTYHDMLKHNTDVIVEALTSSHFIDQEADKDKPKNIKLSYFLLGLVAIGGLIFIIIKMSN